MFLFCDKPTTRNTFWKKGFISSYFSNKQSVTEGRKGGTQADWEPEEKNSEAMEECCLRACSSWLAQYHILKCSTAHSGLAGPWHFNHCSGKCPHRLAYELVQQTKPFTEGSSSQIAPAVVKCRSSLTRMCEKYKFISSSYLHSWIMVSSAYN